MTTYQKKTNKLVTCPFDSAHKCLESRLQMHITKCRLNNLDKDKEVCPFNAQHRIDRGSMDYHIMNCPNRAPLDKQLAANSDKNNIFRGCTSVPCYTQKFDTGSESWDNEINCDGRAGYTPSLLPPKGGIIMDMGLAKPAARKEYYKNLHIRDDDAKSEASSPAVEILKNVRQPKQHPEELMMQAQSVKTIENLGLGRGSTCIAANISGLPSQNVPPIRPQSSSPLSSSMQNMHLGLGRGHARSAAPVPSVYDDLDFPIVGIGRSGR